MRKLAKVLRSGSLCWCHWAVKGDPFLSSEREAHPGVAWLQRSEWRKPWYESVKTAPGNGSKIENEWISTLFHTRKKFPPKRTVDYNTGFWFPRFFSCVWPSVAMCNWGTVFDTSTLQPTVQLPCLFFTNYLWNCRTDVQPMLTPICKLLPMG